MIGIDFENGPTFCCYVGQISHKFTGNGLFRDFWDRSFGRYGPFLGDIFGRSASGQNFLNGDSTLSFGCDFLIIWIDNGGELFAEGFGDYSKEVIILIEDLLEWREYSFGGFIGHGREFFGKIHGWYFITFSNKLFPLIRNSWV